MNTVANIDIPTVPGTPFEGGFYVARFRLADATYALISSGAAGDRTATEWISGHKDVPAACNFNDGAANTTAMVEAGSRLAKSIRELHIGGFGDWYLPSRDELELLYRYLKPTTETNFTYRSGENPSGLPATHPYTQSAPVQTPVLNFQEGHTDALEADGYWSSTQSSRSSAWYQYFDDGNQNGNNKSAELRARPVRRFRID